MAGKIYDALTGADRKRAAEIYRTYKRDEDMPPNEAMVGVEGAKQSLSGAIGNRDAVDAMSRAQRAADSETKRELSRAETMREINKKKGGVIKSSASRRADGCAVKGKTKGRIV